MSFEDNGLVMATEILILIFLLGSFSSEAYSKVLKTHMDDLNTEAITKLAAKA